MKKFDLFICGIFVFVIGVFLTALTFSTTKDTKPKKVYPVCVVLSGRTIFHCDSANLNYAWKDGVRIQIKNVYEIKFD